MEPGGKAEAGPPWFPHCSWSFHYMWNPTEILPAEEISLS